MNRKGSKMIQTNGKATELEKWPTARAVAAKLGCSRQQVYKLEKRGKLSGRESGKIRRFDPATVAALAEDDDELEMLLAGESVAAEDEDEDEGPPPRAMQLAAKVVTESRQMAADARRGQQEAYDLLAAPTREYTKLLMQALEAREKRIAELEERLNKFHDEQRDARRDDREAAFFQSRLEREDDRKDQMWKLFLDNLPLVLQQLKASMGGSGPFVEWMKKRTPAEQQKLVMAIETVVGFDESEKKNGSQKAD
jgi:hypothetical protein